MTMGMASLASIPARREDRDEVYARVRAHGPDTGELQLLVVNLSPHGLMARCDTDYEPGQRLRITLPVAGAVIAEIRWALGGRIGCQFDTSIERTDYYQMLAVMLRGN